VLIFFDIASCGGITAICAPFWRTKAENCVSDLEKPSRSAVTRARFGLEKSSRSAVTRAPFGGLHADRRQNPTQKSPCVSS
jgi:hypothetical protein